MSDSWDKMMTVVNGSSGDTKLTFKGVSNLISDKKSVKITQVWAVQVPFWVQMSEAGRPETEEVIMEDQGSENGSQSRPNE